MNRSFITVFVAFWIVAYMRISLLQEIREDSMEMKSRSRKVSLQIDIKW